MNKWAASLRFLHHSPTNVALLLAVMERVAEAEEVLDTLPLALPLALMLPLGDLLSLDVWLLDGVPEGLLVLEALAVTLGVTLGPVALAVMVVVGVTVPLLLALAPSVCVAVTSGVCVVEGVPVCVPLGLVVIVAVALGSTPCVKDDVLLGVGVPVCVPVSDGVPVFVGVTLRVLVALAGAPGLRVAVPVALCVPL